MSTSVDCAGFPRTDIQFPGIVFKNVCQGPEVCGCGFQFINISDGRKILCLLFRLLHFCKNCVALLFGFF